MDKLLLPIVTRRWLLGTLTGLALGMLVLMQLLFRAQLGHLPGLDTAPVIPDTRFYYTAGELIAALDVLGPVGRAVYRHLHGPDMLFPLVYGLFFASLIVFSWGLRGRAMKTASLLALVPVMAALADWTENVAIELVSGAFRAHSAAEISASAPFAASLAGVATASKWSLSAASALLIVAGMVFALCRRARED